MENILITHGDLDGTGCAVLGRLLFDKDSLFILSSNYKTVDNHIKKTCEYNKKAKRIIIADIAPQSEESVKILLAHPAETFFFDHHQGTEKFLKYFPINSRHSIEYCGSYLMFDFFKNDLKRKLTEKSFLLLEEFMFLVNDYDLWKHTSKLSRRLNTLRYMDSFQIFVEKIVKRLLGCQNLISENENLIIDDRTKQVEYESLYWAKNGHFMSNSDGQTALVIYSQISVSDVCEKIFEELRPEAPDFILNVNTKHKSIDVRTKNLRAFALAKANGGGGHKDAAGFSLKSEHLCNFPILNIVWPSQDED